MAANMTLAIGFRSCQKNLITLLSSRTISVANHRCKDTNLPVDSEQDKPSLYKTEIKEITTHTGQRWDEDDYRLVRFTEAPKQINPRFAIDLVAEEPPIAVKARNTYCDGGDGPLGHPKVFINLDQPGNHTCGYCGLRFYQEDAAHH